MLGKDTLEEGKQRRFYEKQGCSVKDESVKTLTDDRFTYLSLWIETLVLIHT